ncbi:MAG: PAS domain-containing protein, partial [Chloroflexota bacterium]
MKQSPIGEQALFKTLASLTEDLIFVIDARETVEYVNPSTARMFRATPGDMIGRRMRDLFPPDVHERHSRNVGQVLELGVTLTFEEWSSFPAGDLYLSTQLIPLKDTKGTVTSILGVCRDITEGRMNEEKVGHAKREWERALDSMSELVAIVDLRHRFVRVNKAMSDKLGVKPRDLVGKVCHETVHAAGVPPAYCPLMKMKSDSREHTAEIPCDDA